MTIVLFGVKGSGKDTVGDILVRGSGYRKEAFANPIKEMVRLAFPRFTEDDLYGSSEARERWDTNYRLGDRCLVCNAKLVPCEVDDRADLICSSMECSAGYPAFVNARIALQTLGTEWGRRLCPDVWVDACFARIAVAESAHGGLAATSPSGIVDAGAVILKRTPLNFVVTDGRFKNELARSKELGAFCVRLTRGLAESTSQHPSEREFREIPDIAFDYVIDNANIPLDGMPEAVARMLALIPSPRSGT